MRFTNRIVAVKFRAISSEFSPSKGVVCNLGENMVFFGKLYFPRVWAHWKGLVMLVAFLSWLVTIRRTESPQITQFPWTHLLRANLSFPLPHSP